MQPVLHAARTFALVCTAFFACSAVSLAQGTSTTGTSSIDGTVTNANSQGPVSGAAVELLGTGVDQTTHTDANGTFTFTGLPSGTYSVKTRAAGFTPGTSAPFNVGASQAVTIAVALQPISGASLRTISSIKVNGKQSVNTSSTPTFTITNRQFVLQGQVLVEQGLEQVPGVTIQHYDGGLGSVATLTIRGAGGFTQGGNTGYEVLVLQDGQPMRNGQYGDADLSTLTPSIYSRVEVLEGVGGTSLFGANSIGGTLNLVTRDPNATEGGQFLGGLGGFGTYNYSLLQTNTIGRFGYLIDLNRVGSQGSVPGSLYADYGSGPGVGTLWHPTQDFSLESDLVKLKYQFSPVTYVTLSQQGESDMRDQLGLLTNPTTQNGSANDSAGYPFFYGFPGDQLWNTQPKMGVDLHSQIGGGDLLLRSYGGTLNRVDDGTGEPESVCCYIQDSVDRLYGDEAYWTKPLGNHLLTLAAGGNGDSYYYGYTYGSFGSPVTIPDISFTGGKQIERTYMANDAWQVNPKLAVNLTGYYSSYDTLQVKRFDPRLGLVYRPDLSTAIRFSAASGFAAPRLSDLYNPFNNSANSATSDPRCPQDSSTYGGYCVASTGNPNLKSETAKGTDLGIDHTFGYLNRGLISFDLYQTNLDNHLYYVNLPAAPGTGNFAGKNPPGGLPILFVNTPINLAHAVYEGFQLNGALPVTHNFSITGYYTTQAAYPTGLDYYTQFNSGDTVNNQQFEGVPVHQLGYGVQYNNLFGAQAFFRGDYMMQNNAYNVPPFWLYNAGVSEPLPNNNELILSWQNIFNKNATIFSLYNAGVPYPGVAGPYGESTHPANPHSLTLTFSHSWGSVANP